MTDNEKNTDEIPEEEKPEESDIDTGAEPSEDEAAASESVAEVTKEDEKPETSEPAGEPEKEPVMAVSEEEEDVEIEEEAEEEKVEEPAREQEAEEEEKISCYDKVAALMQGSFRDDLPDFRPGDTVKVHVKIVEGSKERIQVFEGVVIALKHGGLDRTFTVRKTSWGVGVERTFFLNSPKIDKIKVVRRGRVRRAKLYYLRERAGKSARIRERRPGKT